MSHERPSSADRQFVRAILPWGVAAAALVVYLFTLNHWVSLTSLGPTAKLSGWTWQAEFAEPVTWLVTLPFRLLPVRLIPIAINLFTAVCATLTLALLARSVALLPHDRTYEQRQRQTSSTPLLAIPAAWVPPVFAVAVCGLGLTFWENATVANTEMLDLLLFAYVIRCLLEFRLDEREGWLAKASFVCGLGMTNNWAMIGFFPLFFVALVWLMGLGFFNIRFLVRMFIWGLAGLSLYLLLPIAQHGTSLATLPFWPALKLNLATQQYALRSVWQYFTNNKQDALLLALTSLVPVLLISIRWASYFGDTSHLGILLTTLIFHFVNGLFFLLLIWTSLDPTFSPRNKIGSGLTLTYLAALGIGYFSGYFLLLFGTQSDESKKLPPEARFINLGITTAVWILVALTPALLVYRNLPQIRMSNGPMVRLLAAALTRELPPKAVVLGDDKRLLQVEQAAAAQAGTSQNYMFLDTSSLSWPDYHRYLKRKYPDAWPSNPPKESKQLFESGSLMNIISILAESNSVYYSQPSFGYYFEIYYAVPHGLVYQLAAYPDNFLLAPPLSETVVTNNEHFWTAAENDLIQPVLLAVRPPAQAEKPSLLRRAQQAAQLKWAPNREASHLAAIYSRALDDWGVRLQDNGRWKEAAHWFQLAADLQPENLVARINLDCNQKVQAGNPTVVENTKPITDLFGEHYRTWDEVMRDNGPFFDPTFCYAQARQYLLSALYRQAATQMRRVRFLSPGNFDARLWLAQLYVLGRLPEQALQQLAELHDGAGGVVLSRTNAIALLSVETSAHLAANDPPGASAVVQAALEKYPKDTNVLNAAATAYAKGGYFTNAIEIYDRWLKLAPNNANILLEKAYACMQLEKFSLAIELLDRVLALQANNYSAMLNRAICYLKSDQLEAAQKDYDALQKANPTDFMLYFGLGEIAYRKLDTNAATRNYELYLANTSHTNGTEANFVRDRLKALKLGRRTLPTQRQTTN